MANTRFLWVGDLHIDGLDSYFPDADDPNDGIFNALNQAVSHAKSEGIEYVILPGDIFDNPTPRYSSMIRLITFFLKYPDLTFICYWGNHDYETENNISISMLRFVKEMQVLPNVRVFMKPTAFKLDGVPFQVLPWPVHKRIDGAPPSVILAHVTVSGIKMASGYVARSKVIIEPGNDLWVIGDIHERIKYHKRIHYPGLMYQTNFGEKEGKGFTVYDVETSKKHGIKFSHKFYPVVPPFRLINVIVKSVEDLEQITTDPTHRYKLFIKDDFVLPIDFLTKHPNVVWHTKFKNNKQLSISTDPEALEAFIEDNGDRVKNKRKIAVHGLKEFFVSKGWDEDKIKRAKRIALGIVEKISDRNTKKVA